MAQESLKEKLNMDPEVAPSKAKFDVADSNQPLCTEPSKPLDSSILTFDETKPMGALGMRYILMHMGSLIVMNILAKELMQYHGITPFEIIYSRGVVSVIMSMIYLKMNDIYLFSVETDKSAIVLLGALIGFVSLAGFYLSLCGLTLTEAFALSSISSLFALVGEHLWFGSTIRFYHLLALLSAVVGGILMLRPFQLFSSGSDHIPSLCAIAGLVGALFSGIYGTIVRRVSVKVNLMVNYTFQQFSCALFAPCFVLIFFEVRGNPTLYTFTSVFLLLVVGALGWSANYTLCKALEQEKAVSRVHSFKYGLAVVAILIDAAYFGLGMGVSSWIGLVFLSANLVVGVYYLYYASA